MSEYGTIVADPPWPYRGVAVVGCIKKDGTPSEQVGSVAKYGSMSIDELCALPVPAAKNAHLYLWTTNAFMEEAHIVAKAWGFKPKTVLTWVKTHKRDPARPSMKTGYWFRGATEHVVFATRGKTERKVTNLPTAFLGPREPHSVKPQWTFDICERVSPGPYLEMFARTARPGWDCWGNEAPDPIALES